MKARGGFVAEDGTKTIGTTARSDRAKLDSLFPDRPVVLQRIDGHAVIANGQALRQTGMMDATSVAGGEILRRPDGSPTGVLIDGAADSLLSRIPSPSRAQTVDALKKAERNLVRLGLTTVTDAGLDWPDTALLDSLHRSGVLSLRVMAMANPGRRRTSRSWPVAGGGTRLD